MSCEDVHIALSQSAVCEETSEGARLTTHCLYPSFEPVCVYVAKVGDGYRVHDAGGAFEQAWLHGREEALIGRAIREECVRFRLDGADNKISVSVASRDWLSSAILAVANASSLAAHRAVARIVAAAEEALVDRIGRSLAQRFGESRFRRNVDLTGRSGGKRHFDFVLPMSDNEALLINGVAPHMGSISSKYVAFADTEFDRDHKFAVFDRELGPDDAALLQQVASIVPLNNLPTTAERSLAHVG